MINDEILTNFVDSLNELMTEKSLNPNRLEIACGLNQSIVGQWLKSAATPNLKNLIKLSDFFCCPLDYLLALNNKRFFTKSNHPSTFAERFTLLLLKSEKTESEIAKILGFQKSNVSKWKKGTARPNV